MAVETGTAGEMMGTVPTKKIHAHLVSRAKLWLKTHAAYEGFDGTMHSVRCAVVLSELACTSHEIPDAIGWAYGGRLSILVECKASRSDFRADGKKMFRRHSQLGMGMVRYYFAPSGVIPVDDLPEKWGLLEMVNAGIKIKKLASEMREHCKAHEMAMLWSALRRVQNLDGALALSNWVPELDEEHF